MESMIAMEMWKYFSGSATCGTESYDTNKKTNGDVFWLAQVELDMHEALPSEGRGHRFESCRAHHYFNVLVIMVNH
jgi:hypothetical protein